MTHLSQLRMRVPHSATHTNHSPVAQGQNHTVDGPAVPSEKTAKRLRPTCAMWVQCRAEG